MKICIASDAWNPQVNGVVHTLSRTKEYLESRGFDGLIITPILSRGNKIVWIGGNCDLPISYEIVNDRLDFFLDKTPLYYGASNLEITLKPVIDNRGLSKPIYGGELLGFDQHEYFQGSLNTDQENQSFNFPTPMTPF